MPKRHLRLCNSMVTDIRNNKEVYTVEQIANKIIGDSVKRTIPIDIVNIVKNIGFSVVKSKHNLEMQSAIFSIDDKKYIFRSSSNFIMINKYSKSFNDCRYLIAYTLCDYIMNGNNNCDFESTYTASDIMCGYKKNGGLLAKALLMPQAEVGVFMNSPLLFNKNSDQKLEMLANAFCVSTDIAYMRLSELGYNY